MKPLVIGLVILCVLAFFLLTRSPDVPGSTQGADSTSQSSSGTVLSAESAETSDRRKEASLSEQMEFILTDAHVSSDKYKLLLELLQRDEEAVLAYLAKLRFTDPPVLDSDEDNQVEMIMRAMMEFYWQKPLVENLEKAEGLRKTGPLFTNLVAELLFAGKGEESAQVAYDWVMENPDHPAALRSGAVVGGILSNYTPKEAWEKVVKLPTGAIRTRAFSAVIETTAANDVNAAIDYINSVEATSDLDEAISNVLYRAMSSDYAFPDLIDLASTPIDPVFRSTSLTVLFENWATDNPESLRQWTQETHEFPPAKMEEINLILKQTLQRHQITLSE